MKLLLFSMILGGIVLPVQGASYYTQRPDEPKAVYLTADQFPVRGDGVADDSAALQAAIDQVQEDVYKRQVHDAARIEG